MNKYLKWNSKTREYEPYYVADDKVLKTYSENMNEIVNCCQCLKEIRIGDGYTSMEVHTSIGFGFCVCEECFQEEMTRRKNERGEE